VALPGPVGTSERYASGSSLRSFRPRGERGSVWSCMRGDFMILLALMHRTISLLAVVAMLVGCAGRPSLIPNADKNLRRTSAQFAADSAKRHPYKSSAPRGGEAVARAEVGYMLKQITIVNLSPEAWNDVELWVNQKYVVFVPVMEPNQLKTL